MRDVRSGAAEALAGLGRQFDATARKTIVARPEDRPGNDDNSQEKLIL
jgi:hypothetical protein